MGAVRSCGGHVVCNLVGKIVDEVGRDIIFPMKGEEGGRKGERLGKRENKLNISITEQHHCCDHTHIPLHCCPLLVHMVS